MKLFFSHSSKQKPLIREVRRHLPRRLDAWIDEDQLVFGGHLLQDLKEAVSVRTDYLVVFIDENACNSSWVKQEVEWALEAEKARDHQMIIPVLVGETSLSGTQFEPLAERRLLVMTDFFEHSIRNLSSEISDTIIKLLCDRIEREQQATRPTKKLEDLERMLHEFADEFRQAVFPHRKKNPCTQQDILAKLGRSNRYDVETVEDLDAIVDRARRLNLIAGIHYDDDDVFVVEEHYSWKTTLHSGAKRAVAAAALKKIRPGMTVGIDAGSATAALVELLAKKFANHSLKDVTIITNSLPSAGILSEVGLSEGSSNHNPPFRVILPGGFVRPNTLALVGSEAAARRELDQAFNTFGKADIAFVGVNGISIDGALTTHSNIETQIKASFIENSQTQYALGDHSKIGVEADTIFGRVGGSTFVIVDDHPVSRAMLGHIAGASSNVLIAPQSKGA